MSTDIVIVPAEHRHLSRVETWAARNDAVKTLLKDPKSPSHGTPSGQHWAALLGDEVVAIAGIELDKHHVGYLSCTVKPGRQRLGIGSRVIEHVLSQPSVKSLVHLHSVVDQSNTAAQKILNNNGFTRVGYDGSGHLEFARHTAK